MDKIKVAVEYPNKIYEAEIALLDKIDLIEKGKIEKRRIENEVELKVLEDSKKDEFKESLSNETKRNAKINEILGYHRAFQEIITNVQKYQRELEIDRLKISRDKRLLRSAIALCSMLGVNVE